jgi:cytochrome c oxidase subunit 3
MTQAQEHGGGHGHGHGSRFIQHHYDDAQHQFDAGKLGIWFFLAQEVLFFSALFVAYILYRHHHPEIFAYASHYLDVKWGAINTAVLIISSLTAAWAVRAAQLGQKRLLVGTIAVTIACACGFLVIKYIEYSHKIHEGILFGDKFDPCVSSGGTPLITKQNHCDGTKSAVKFDRAAGKATAGCLAATMDVDPKTPGPQLDCLVAELTFAGAGAARKESGRRDIPACNAPPGAHGHGGPTNKPCWIAQHNPLVCPEGPGVLVLYADHKVRGDNIEIEATCNPAPAAAVPADPFADRPPEAAALGKRAIDPRPEPTKHDLVEEYAKGPPPENTNMFFSIYFAMTGLHGIHVLVGVFVFIWLLVRAMKGHFTPDYFGPIDYAALYWHLVDLIWIFLFPMLYLIH